MENGIKVKTVMEIEVPGRRPVGRPNTRLIDRIRNDMRELNITDDETHNREVWRSRIQATDHRKWE